MGSRVIDLVAAENNPSHMDYSSLIQMWMHIALVRIEYNPQSIDYQSSLQLDQVGMVGRLHSDSMNQQDMAWNMQVVVEPYSFHLHI